VERLALAGSGQHASMVRYDTLTAQQRADCGVVTLPLSATPGKGTPTPFVASTLEVSLPSTGSLRLDADYEVAQTTSGDIANYDGRIVGTVLGGIFGAFAGIGLNIKLWDRRQQPDTPVVPSGEVAG
jgi:hypothetical protein